MTPYMVNRKLKLALSLYLETFTWWSIFQNQQFFFNLDIFYFACRIKICINIIKKPICLWKFKANFSNPIFQTVKITPQNKANILDLESDTVAFVRPTPNNVINCCSTFVWVNYLNTNINLVVKILWTNFLNVILTFSSSTSLVWKGKTQKKQLLYWN